MIRSWLGSRGQAARALSSVGRSISRAGKERPRCPYATDCNHTSDVNELKKSNKKLQQIDMITKAMSSDNIYSQLFTQLQSQHESGSDAGGDDEDADEDEEDADS
ncbi:hypothetical protein Tco_0143410 [Tanacetum coccineum]